MHRFILFVSAALVVSCADGEPRAVDEGPRPVLDAQPESPAPVDAPPLGIDVLAEETGGACVPTEDFERTCNGKDDDCNGIVDDVDVGKDGFCDCLGIKIIGTTGSLAASTFEAWLRGKGTTSNRWLQSAGPLTKTELDGVDVVILDQLSKEFTPAEVDVLEAFVKAGGGLVAMTGYSHAGPDATHPNSVLARLGATYDVTKKITGDITAWNAAHPIANGISRMPFVGGYAVTPQAGFSTTVVANHQGTVPVGVAVEIGDGGRVFVWGDEWIEYDSQWASAPDVTKLWTNIFGWMSQRRCGSKGPS
jgi:hypothetical protein